jgi:PAS domain-containing protein
MSGCENLIESQRAKPLLRESEEHYRAVAEAATDAIITIDSYSTILTVNPATERIFGYGKVCRASDQEQRCSRSNSSRGNE